MANTSNFFTRTLDAWAQFIEQRSGAGSYPAQQVQLCFVPNPGGSFDPTAPISRADTVGVSAVWQAIGLISEAVAGLPWGVYKQDGRNILPDTKHPAHRLLTVQTDSATVPYNFLRALIANALLGDGYARIYRDRQMRPVRMQVVVGTVRLAYAQSGEPYYLVRDTRTGWVNDEEVVAAYDIIHLRNRTLDAMRGLPIEHFFRHVLSADRSAVEHEAAFFRNGAGLDKVITAKEGLTQEQAEKVRSQFQQKYGGPGRAGNTAVLDNGMTIATVGLDLEKAAVITARRFHVEEVARILNVTPHLLHSLERATFNNAEELGRSFVTYTLQPWVKQLEQQLGLNLLTEQQKDEGTHYVRANMSALLRGNVKDRSLYYVQMIQHGVLSPNEVRGLENLNPREGGDDYLTPLNMQKGEGGQPDPNAEPDPQTDTQDEPQPAR